MHGSDERFPYESGLYALALAAALFLRLYRLGAAPLSDFEAQSALQARALLRGIPSVPGSQPLAVVGTAAVFFLFGEANFTARLLSALSGSLLVLLPWFWRRLLGRNTALLLALGLAFAPGLVALSRLCGGPALALTFGVALLTALRRGPSVQSGLLAGLFLLSGPWAWSGLLGFALALGAARGSGLSLGGLLSPWGAEASSRDAAAWRPFFWGAGAAFLLGATLFLRFPQGLGAFGNSLAAWGGAFFSPSGTPFSRALAGWTLYHLLALLMGLAGAFLAWRERLLWGKFALLWMLTALLTVLLFPGRMVFDTAWALLPLYALGARALGAAFELPAWDKVGMWLFASSILVVFSLAWLTLAGMPAGEPALTDTWGRWAVVLGSLAVLLISGVLLGWGWDAATALQGGAVGTTLALGMLMLAQTWGLAFVRPNAPAELWYPTPAPERADLLLRTLGDAAEFHAGHRRALALRLETDSPSLQWALRDFALGQPGQTDALAENAPLAAIAPAGASSPNPDVLYRGQDFRWRQGVQWEGALPPAAVRWFVFREAPVQTETLVLWLRGDLFPGGSILPPASADTSPASQEQMIP